MTKLKLRKTFISFEGCDLSGKSTQIKLIKEYLNSINIDHHITREPGSTKIGEFVRDYIKNDYNSTANLNLLLLMSSRQSHLNEVIEKKNFVISDRYHESSLVYQCLYSNASINLLHYVSQDFLMPDFTFFMYCEDIIDRVEKRKNDRFESKIDQAKINKYFLNLMKVYKSVGCRVDFLSSDENFINRINFNNNLSVHPADKDYNKYFDVKEFITKFKDQRTFIVVDSSLDINTIHDLIKKYFNTNVLYREKE